MRKSCVIFHRRELLFKAFCNAVNEYSSIARAASASHRLSHKKDMSYKAVLPCPSLIRVVLFINTAVQNNFLFKVRPFSFSLIMRLHSLFSLSMELKLPTGEIKKILRLGLCLDASLRVERIGLHTVKELHTVSSHKF